MGEKGIFKGYIVPHGYKVFLCHKNCPKVRLFLWRSLVDIFHTGICSVPFPGEGTVWLYELTRKGTVPTFCLFIP